MAADPNLPRRLAAVFATAALCLGAAPLRAGEVDRFLPADTEVVVTVNIRQILDSPLVKKYGLKEAREALAEMDQVSEILADLGFDPFTDLDRVTVGSPAAGEQDRGLVIARGKFNAVKFKAKAEDTAKDRPDVLKIHKVPDGSGGRQPVYEVVLPGHNDASVFVALAGEDVLLASPGKDYVVEALKKAAGKAKASLKNKDFQAVLERMDDRQSVGVAAVGGALRGEGTAPADDLLARVEAIGGGVTIGDDVKLELVVSAKTAEDGRQLRKAAADALNQATALVGLLATQKDELAPLADALKAVRVGGRDKTLTIKATISADVLQDAFGKDDR
jgi:hypothetical protein